MEKEDLTHDVESAQGLDKCYKLAEMEERLGFSGQQAGSCTGFSGPQDGS